MNDAPTLTQRIYQMLKESQYWPPDQILEFQRSQLSLLLQHAREHVPFYRTRLNPIFDRDGEINWKRWSEIPIVTRADLRDSYAAMLADALPPGHGPTKTFRSSGSSGVPIVTETTRISSDAKRAASWRFYRNQNIDSGKTHARFSSFAENGETLREEYYLKKWEGKQAASEKDIQEVVINRKLPEPRKLQLLQSFGIRYINDITNNAELLANANLHVENPVKLDAVICSGQTLTAYQKELFQKSFGARGLSIYSSKEGSLMACQCGDGPTYHLNSELVRLEIVDAEGKVCEPGEMGRVIITPLYGTALPLIRYDQGDTAELHPSCACGSTLPVLKNITGRQDQILKLPDGPRAVGGLFQNLMRENLNALAFQLAQVAPLMLEIRYVPIDPSKKFDEAPIVAHVHAQLHPDMAVVFKQIEEIPLNSGGKQQRVVCEIDTGPVT